MIGPVDAAGPAAPRGPDDPDGFHDDLLVTLLRPAPEALPLRPGSFDRIRRGATRRRRVRAALGGGLAVAAVAAVAVPVLLAGARTPTTVPAPPLAPPTTVGAPHSPAPVSSPTPTRTPRPAASTRAVPTASGSPDTSPPRTVRIGGATARSTVPVPADGTDGSAFARSLRGTSTASAGATADPSPTAYAAQDS